MGDGGGTHGKIVIIIFAPMNTIEHAVGALYLIESFQSHIEGF